MHFITKTIPRPAQPAEQTYQLNQRGANRWFSQWLREGVAGRQPWGEGFEYCTSAKLPEFRAARTKKQTMEVETCGNNVDTVGLFKVNMWKL